MEYYEFKFFKTDFPSNHELSDDILKSGCGNYMIKMDELCDERVHVILSWSELFKIISYVMLLFALLFLLQNMSSIYIILSVGLSFILNLIKYFLDRRIVSILTNHEFVKSFLQSDNYGLLEEMRQELLEK